MCSYSLGIDPALIGGVGDDFDRWRRVGRAAIEVMGRDVERAPQGLLHSLPVAIDLFPEHFTRLEIDLVEFNVVDGEGVFVADPVLPDHRGLVRLAGQIEARQANLADGLAHEWGRWLQIGVLAIAADASGAIEQHRPGLAAPYHSSTLGRAR